MCTNRATLYVSDLDGTLLQPDGNLSNVARTALNSWLEAGCLFTVATARSVTSIREKLDGLPLRLPVIEQNGSFVSWLDGEHLVTNAIDPAAARGIWQLAHEAGVSPFLCTFDGKLDHVYHGDSANECMHAYIRDRQQVRDPRFLHGRAPRDGLDEQVVGFTVADREPVCRKLEQEVLEVYPGQVQTNCIEEIYHPGWHWLTIHAAAATKGFALRELIQHQALQSCRVVVFGDQVNDLGLFAEADHAVAVGNAVADVKVVAHEITGPNTDDSVVSWIRQDRADAESGVKS